MSGLTDPLLLGQRVLAILEHGQRDATYKLATLMALIEHSLENLPAHADDPLAVPIPELAHRVLALYWHQVRPFDGQELAQRRTGSRTRIIDATKALRDAARAGRGRMSLELAMLRAPAAYTAAIDRIALALIKQPLPRLQKLPGAAVSDPFLYDDSFLGENVSRSTVRAQGDAIVLKPGVAAALARLAGLLKPALEFMWVEDVRRMNKFLDSDVPDVAGHLFGRERTALAAIRAPYKEVFGPHCFYCGTHLPPDNPIDHVLPWSLVGIDGLAIWYWRADGATATRAMRCPRWRSSIAPLLSRGCRPWRTSQQTCSGRRSANASSRRRAASTVASRQGSRLGRHTSAVSGWTSAFRRGGSRGPNSIHQERRRQRRRR